MDEPKKAVENTINENILAGNMVKNKSEIIGLGTKKQRKESNATKSEHNPNTEIVKNEIPDEIPVIEPVVEQLEEPIKHKEDIIKPDQQEHKKEDISEHVKDDEESGGEGFLTEEDISNKQEEINNPVQHNIIVDDTKYKELYVNLK